MKKFTHFLFYNNTIPFIFGILFIGAGATYAASPELLLNTSASLVSVDNSYLLEADLDSFALNVGVTAITEDSSFYFVEYKMSTIDVQSGIWMPITKTRMLEVKKETVQGIDLGLYISEELAEVREHELRRLKETQVLQRRDGQSQKVVATEYSGLVGRFLDPSTETFPGYNTVREGQPLTAEQKKVHEKLQEELAKQRELEEKLKSSESQVTTNTNQVIAIPPIRKFPIPVPTGGTGTSSSPQPAPVVPPTPPEPVPTPEPTPVPEPTPEIILDPTPAPTESE